MNSLVEIQKLMAFIVMKVPENDKDKNYQKEFFRTSIDFQKIFNGVQGSFISKILTESLFKHADFQLKFPFKKVKLNITILNI